MQKAQQIVMQEVNRCFATSDVAKVLVAVSGGADSVALLRLCHSLSLSSNLHIEAVNCNFHLRGKESDRDSEFTAKLCNKLGVKLHSLHYDVDKYMSHNPGISIEMACRDLRYKDFFRIADEGGFDRIAVAHNADDDIETMMLNMLRGSGSRGLRGMDIDNGKIIRPLLTTPRGLIEKYLEEIGQDFVTDSSNLTSDYRRNFLRHEVIPLLEKRWPGARKSLARTVGIMKEEAGIVEKYYSEKLGKLSDGNILNIYDSEMTCGIAARFLERFGGNVSIAEELMEASTKPFGRRTWQLGSEYEAVLERHALVVRNPIHDEISDISLEWEEIDMSEKMMDVIRKNSDNLTQYFPNGADDYTLRKPMKGDRISPLGMKGSRLVSDVISDGKLDRNMKSQIRVLVRNSDEEIIWVTGLKRSRHDLVDPSAKSCYRCRINFPK